MALDLRPFEIGDEEAILSLFGKSFGKPIAPDFWSWRFLDNPCGSPMIELAWDGTTLAAHYAVSPGALTVDGERHLGALSMTTMTHPAYRGQGLFVKLATSLFDRMVAQGYKAVWGFPNWQSHRGFIRDLAWSDVHEIPTLRLDMAGGRKIEASGSFEPVRERDSRIDSLWQRCRRTRRILGWRDAAHLEWRYLRHPTNRYEVLLGEDGYVVYKRFGREVDIVDVLIADEDAGVLRGLVREVVERNPEAVAINTWMVLNSPLHLELEKLGFVATAPTTYLGVRAFAALDVDVADVRHWYYTMGDSDVY